MLCLTQSRQSGFSLIELLISTGVLMTGFVAFSHLYLQQTKDVAMTRTKMDLLQVRDEVRQAMMMSEVCRQNFAGHITIDDASVGNSGYELTLNQLTDSTAANPVFRVGSNIPNVSTPVITDRIRLINFRRGVNAQEYKFDAEVRLRADQGPLANTGVLPPIRLLGFNVRTDAAGLATDCRLGGLAGGGQFRSCQKVQLSSYTSIYQIMVYCSAGQRAIAGGARCFAIGGTQPDERSYLHQSHRIIDGAGIEGWRADCYNRKPTGAPGEDISGSEVYAVCCS